MTLRVLDLFPGFGGASQAFLDAGDDVLRIENNPLLNNVPNTHMMDVEDLLQMLQEYAVARGPERYDLVWASPPCLEFSQAYAAPGPTARREGVEFEPNMNPMRCAKEIIDLLQPKWWVIENVRGACPHFNAELGKPAQVIGPLVLWGRVPELKLPEGYTHRKADQDKRWSPLRANHRALIPLEVSAALRRAIVSQTQIV